MQNLVEVLAKALVDNPGLVQVKQVEKDKSLVLELKVAEEDMGKIIGKQGRIAKAIRTVVKAAATKTGKRVIVEIIQ
ncbi:MAG: KH domain-containing protein [Bacillota bacterium]